MVKRILLSGAVGFLVLAIWTFVVNGVFRFAVNIEMNQLPDERRVYAVLQESVVEPGAYVVNPAPESGVGYPANQPVFGLTYAGFGHEAAGRMVFKDLAMGILGPLLVAVLLSMASPAVLSRYWRKVVFVVIVGILLAMFGDVGRFGIGGYPSGAALLLAANTIASWTLVGAAMAWSMGAPQDAPGAT